MPRVSPRVPFGKPIMPPQMTEILEVEAENVATTPPPSAPACLVTLLQQARGQPSDTWQEGFSPSQLPTTRYHGVFGQDVICLRRHIRLVRLCVVVAWCTRAFTRNFGVRRSTVRLRVMVCISICTPYSPVHYLCTPCTRHTLPHPRTPCTHLTRARPYSLTRAHRTIDHLLLPLVRSPTHPTSHANNYNTTTSVVCPLLRPFALPRPRNACTSRGATPLIAHVAIGNPAAPLCGVRFGHPTLSW